jgi:hypothetical protein
MAKNHRASPVGIRTNGFANKTNQIPMLLARIIGLIFIFRPSTKTGATRNRVIHGSKTKFHPCKRVLAINIARLNGLKL